MKELRCTVELLSEPEVLILLSPHRFQKLPELEALAEKALPPVLKNLHGKVRPFLLYYCRRLKNKRCIEERHEGGSISFRLTPKGDESKQALYKSFESPERPAHAQSEP